MATARLFFLWINHFNPCGVDGLIVKKRPDFDYEQCLMAQTQNNQLAQLATEVFAALCA